MTDKGLQVGDRGQPPLPGGLLVWLAIQLAMLAAVLGIWAVVRDVYPAPEAGSGMGALGWGMLQAALLLLAVLAAALATRCIRQAEAGGAMIFSTATVLYGLVFLGTLAIQRHTAAQSDLPQIIAAAMAQTSAAPHVASDAHPLIEEAPAESVGDASRGRTAYVASCAACHGPQAGGVMGVAPALRDTDYMQQASDADLWSVIVDGRAADDPASVTGRLMPPRGGNPFLSDADAQDIIAYLHSLADGDAVAQVAGDDDVQALLPRWVLPAAGTGPVGISEYVRHPPAVAPPQPTEALKLSAAVLMAFHLTVAMAIGAWLLVRMAGEPGDRRALALGRVAGVYWLTALGAWALLTPLFYGLF